MNSHRIKICGASLFLVGWLGVGVAYAQAGPGFGPSPSLSPQPAPAQQQAQQQAAQPTFDASEIGHATHEWLALQVGGAEAAPHLPTPGAQASLAYARYMASFNGKIPAQFGSSIGSAGQGTAASSEYPESGGQQ